MKLRIDPSVHASRGGEFWDMMMALFHSEYMSLIQTITPARGRFMLIFERTLAYLSINFIFISDERMQAEESTGARDEEKVEAQTKKRGDGVMCTASAPPRIGDYAREI